MFECGLITGASSGIGYELAKVFAPSCKNLILVARRKDKLQQLSLEISSISKVKIFTITADLTNSKERENLFLQVQQLELFVDLVINNAGAGYVNSFHQEPFKRDLSTIQLNITALTHLTKYFLTSMITNRKGTIINVASTGAFHPGPYTSVYYATKSYVLSFSKAIRKEAKPFGIHVCTLCPGATHTEFSMHAGRKVSPFAMSASKVAKIAYHDVLKHKNVCIPGIANKLLVHIPHSIITPIIARYQQSLMRS